MLLPEKDKLKNAKSTKLTFITFSVILIKFTEQAKILYIYDIKF